MPQCCQIDVAGMVPAPLEPGMCSAMTSLSAVGVAQLAARREPYPSVWEKRFVQLIESGVLGLPKNPGTETALHIRRVPFTNDVNRIVSFCAERMLIARRSNCVIGIDLSHVQPEQFSIWLGQFQSELATALAGIDLSATSVMFSLLDEHPGVESFLELRHSRALGYPTLAIRYNTGTPRCELRERRWQTLVAASHADSRIKLVPIMAVRPLSGLHVLERGDCVMPDSLFEVSADTAWMMLEIDATKLGSPTQLRVQLSDCLRFADNLIDEIAWQRPMLQLDALLNRRVAIHINRLGDLLCRHSMNPSSVDTFRWLKRWLRFVRRCFVHESMLLARRRGPFPELGANELIAELTPRYGVNDARRLVQNRCLRHRHLLALSPFALFPNEPVAHADEHWLNLIPAIDCADALTMYGPDPRTRLSLHAWCRLLQMTGALGARDVVVAHK